MAAVAITAETKKPMEYPPVPDNAALQAVGPIRKNLTRDRAMVAALNKMYAGGVKYADTPLAK